MFEVLTLALWYILPAYVANGSAVIVHDHQPLDLGLKFFDGRPLLGKGKTIGGFLSGVIAGSVFGFIQAGLVFYFSGFLDFGIVFLAFVLSFGAMVGDSLGSFIKRRFDLKRGQAMPILDQWDFILGAFLFAFVFGVSLPSLTEVLVILVVTPLLHIIANYIAFKCKLKGVPW